MRNSLRIAFLVVGILLVLGVLSCMGLDRPAPIDYYRQIDEQTIAVGAGTGPTLWARVTSVAESDTAVTIEARSVAAPVPSTGDAVTELNVTLGKPLSSRRVIDGSSGLDVRLRISRDDAVRIAQTHVGQSAELISADIVSSALWTPDQPAFPAWVVHFRGNFGMPCPVTATGPITCPDLHSAIVVLDLDGAFVSTTYD